MDVISYMHDFLAVKICMEKLVIDLPENMKVLREYPSAYSVQLMASIIPILSATDADLWCAVSLKIVLEYRALRVCTLTNNDYGALEARIAALERASIIGSSMSQRLLPCRHKSKISKDWRMTQELSGAK